MEGQMGKKIVQVTPLNVYIHVMQLLVLKYYSNDIIIGNQQTNTLQNIVIIPLPYRVSILKKTHIHYCYYRCTQSIPLVVGKYITQGSNYDNLEQKSFYSHVQA